MLNKLIFFYDVHVTVHRDKFLIIKPTRCTNFSKLYSGIKLHMFQTVPLSIIRSFTLYTQQWYMSYRFADSLRAGSGCNCSSIFILLASCQQTCMTYTTVVCTVKNSWWWTEERSEIFQTVPLSIVRSFSLYTQQWYTS